MRKGKRARIQPTAWLFALALPAAVLFVLFSLLPYRDMVSPWPLGIGQGEVMAFQKVFDRRPGQHADGEAGFLALSSPAGDCRSGPVTAATVSDTAGMEVNSLPGSDGGLELLAQKPDGLDGMGRIALVPADLASLEALYAQAVADSLPIANPALSLVRLSRCGTDAGPWLMQEALSSGMLLRTAPFGSRLLGTNGQFVDVPEGGDKARQPRLDVAAFDTSATAALGFMACLEQRQDLLNAEAGVLYDGITGRIVPMYRMRYGADTSGADKALAVALRGALQQASVQAHMVTLAGKFRADSATWSERFTSIDSARVPVLANGRNIGLVQAAVDRTRANFMQRLFHPDPEILIGPPVQATPAEPAVLDPWLAQFRSGKDTLRFVRGKYDIDHDLDIPAGYGVVLEKGTRWNIAAGVNITIHGEFHARGTELNPVFIRPLDGSASYGSISVAGGGATRVRLRGVHISGGSEQWANGLHRPGMLSFVRCDVDLEKCSIGSSTGPASVSVQRGRVNITDNYFIGAGGASLSLAEVEGTVERCGFSGQGSTASNGMLLNGSNVLVRGCTFNAIPEDALRCSGGSKAAVIASTCSGNGTGINAGEGSVVHVDGSSFTGNGTAVKVSGGMPVLGETRVVLHTNTFNGNDKDQVVEGGKVERDAAAFDPEKWSSGPHEGQ